MTENKEDKKLCRAQRRGQAGRGRWPEQGDLTHISQFPSALHKDPQTCKGTQRVAGRCLPWAGRALLGGKEGRAPLPSQFQQLPHSWDDSGLGLPSSSLPLRSLCLSFVNPHPSTGYSRKIRLSPHLQIFSFAT